MEAIQVFLSEKKMSQADFGKKLGVGQTMVQQWISKKRGISIEKALDIEYHFGIDAVLLNPEVGDIIKMVQSRDKWRLKEKQNLSTQTI
jgi:transcriptional regulator with XRE-family HTH domain